MHEKENNDDLFIRNKTLIIYFLNELYQQECFVSFLHVGYARDVL
jgi:hypothetical protein